MGLLTPHERDRLVNLLTRLPGIEYGAVRTLLVNDAPEAVRLRVPFVGIPQVDLANIVGTAEREVMRQPDGSWPVARVIENAIQLVPDTALAAELQNILNAAALRHSLSTQAASPDKPHSSENAGSPQNLSGALQARVPEASKPADLVHLPTLRNQIAAAFNREELDLLCEDLTAALKELGVSQTVSIEDIGGGTKPVMIQNLISWFVRRRMLDILLHELRSK